MAEPSVELKNDDVPKREKEQDEQEIENIPKEQERISHEELVKLTKEAIANIIESDPLFKNLPLDPTIDEIRAQIAVARGQSIELFLERGPLPTLSIVVRMCVQVFVLIVGCHNLKRFIIE